MKSQTKLEPAKNERVQYDTDSNSNVFFETINNLKTPENLLETKKQGQQRSQQRGNKTRIRNHQEKPTKNYQNCTKKLYTKT
jgi:hypothetical protein